MDFQVEIEYFKDSAGICAIVDFIENLPIDHQAWIFKRDDFFQSMTFQQLIQTPYFEKIKGTKYHLWELKYLGSRGRSYRMVCMIWKRNLVGLVIFEGSGSDGRLRKYLKKAIELGENWKKRNP